MRRRDRERLEVNICRLRGWYKSTRCSNSLFILTRKDVRTLLKSLLDYEKVSTGKKK